MVNTILNTDMKNAEASTAGTSTVSHTIPAQLLNQLIPKVQRNLVLRGLAAAVYGPRPGFSLRVPMVVAGRTMYVDRVAESSEFPVSAEEYTSFELVPYKYGVRIYMSSEVGEDSGFELFGHNIDQAARELAENEESLIIATLDAGASANTTAHNVANSNATLPISDITAGMQYLEEDNHVATDFICGVEIANDLRNIDTFVEANKSGVMNPTKRLIGTIFQMNVYVSTAVSNKLAYIIDRRHAFVIYDKRPITVKTSEVIERDSTQAVVSQRFATRYLRMEAIAEITTT